MNQAKRKWNRAHLALYCKFSNIDDNFCGKKNNEHFYTLTETNSVCVFVIGPTMFESVNIANVHDSNKSCLIFKNTSNRLKFPYKIKSVDASINESLLRDFTGTEHFNSYFVL